jgi:predicted phage terminase large subunit-like protein
MIKRRWIKRFDEPPSSSERLFVLQSWDTASKGGPENDFSVCTTWVVTRDRRWYLIDVWRKRVDYPALKSAVIALAARHKPRRGLIEDAASGTALVQELRGKVIGVLGVKPDRDKVSRMSTASARFEEGLVHLPERAPRLADFEMELLAFPGVKNDDQCDSVSQALIERTARLPIIITSTMLAEASKPGPYTKTR